MLLYTRQMIFICRILCIHGCRKWGWSLPLVLRLSLTSVQTLLLPGATRAPAVNLKAGLIRLEPSTPPPPWPWRITPGHRVFLPGSWFMRLGQRNKGSGCVWSVQVKTLRRHFEKAPAGIGISSATPVKAALRSTRQPVTRAQIQPPPALRLPPVSLAERHAARDRTRTAPVWLTASHDTKAKRWYFIKPIILRPRASSASWPRFPLLLKRDGFNLSSVLPRFLISFSDFLILWHSTLNYSLPRT